ncbi:MAG: sigma-70 family RNA polymerase sigma factor [Candidatus Eisenbacteria bacterium]
MDSSELRTEIVRHRADLLRIATIQLRDPHLAEDVVQEALLAALQSAETYEGRAKLKTWLVGILKFKVLDALRSRARSPRTMTDLEAERGTTDVDALFDETGTWREKPREWEDPTHGTRQRDFDRVLERCLEKLPGVAAQAFVLREVFELEAEEVCSLVSVTRNHLNVLLYRARMSLRRCLDLHWVAEEGATT